MLPQWHFSGENPSLLPPHLTLSWHRFFATLIKKRATLLMEYAVVSSSILGTSRVIRYYQCLGSYDEYTQLAILHHFCGADIQKQSCFVTTHRDSEPERRKADQGVYKGMTIPSYLSLLFLHVIVVSWAALGYTMSPSGAWPDGMS